ncbi:SGNH/GDSL hydrolase family protein [Candidatus Albibeggiatoa sp. nov. NOAA]|uniref:SGNH/GDSL hydrolase family protein n=1 Tax=Candidatus Albibeggiatoa sp. nov. NOAA TaxID=3162724 RepID=UPI0032F6540B|nr:SGNH/GDSL hydrolase family protein [Thiotrichaceae bacterium]
MFYRKLIKPLASACLALSLTTSAWAATYNSIYVFGDSLSDTGNLFAATSIPPSPYFLGRITNGKAWVEYLHESLDLTYDQANNYAWAGARTDDTNMLDNIVRFTGGNALGLSEQVDSYLASNTVDTESLYIVWAGPNDYLKDVTGTNPAALAQPGEYIINDIEQQVATSVSNIVAALDKLSQAGVSNILVMGMADTGGTPNVAKLGLTTEITAISIEFNDILQAAIEALSYDVLFFDVYTLNVTAAANPESYGLTNTTDACFTVQSILSSSTCSNPSEYLSWDGTHPTTTVHEIIASSLYTFLQEDNTAPTDITGNTPDITTPDTSGDTVVDDAACNGSVCDYSIDLNTTGFYVATAGIADGGSEGVFGISTGFTGASDIFGGFHLGAVLDTSVAGFASFELADTETEVAISVYEYTGVVSELSIVITDSSNRKVFNSSVATGSTTTISDLSAGGQYTIEVLQRGAGNARGQFGLSVIGNMVNSINMGGLIDDSGSAFLAFYTDAASTQLNLYYGDSYGNAGATQPDLDLYSFNILGNALVFSNH